jgi:hypothetical protein
MLKGVRLVTPFAKSWAFIPMAMCILSEESTGKTKAEQGLLIKVLDRQRTTRRDNVNKVQTPEVTAVRDMSRNQSLPRQLQAQAQFTEIDAPWVKGSDTINPRPVNGDTNAKKLDAFNQDGGRSGPRNGHQTSSNRIHLGRPEVHRALSSCI